MKKTKLISSQIVFKTKYFNLRKDIFEYPSGEVDDYTFLDQNDSAMVLALNGDKKLILIKQYRYLTGSEVLEFPAGFAHDKETIEEAAKREFEEETGYECGNLIELGTFYETYSSLNRRIHLFFTLTSKKVDEFVDKKSDKFEFISKLVFYSIDEAVKLAVENKLNGSSSALSVLLLKEKIDRGEIKI